MRVGSIVRIVAALTGERLIDGVGVVGGVSVGGAQGRRILGKTAGGMATGTGSAAGAGRSARGSGVDGVVPFGSLDVVGQRIVTLRAGPRAITNGDGIGVSRNALRIHMLAAGAVTVFALDVGQALQFGRHAGPVAVGQHAGESPAIGRRHVVKAAVVGVGIITNRVTVDAVLAVVAVLQTVNGPGEERGMRRICPSWVNAGHTNEAAAVTGGASPDAEIIGRGNGRGDIGRDGGDVRSTGDTGCGDRGEDGILADNIRAQAQ